MAFFAFKLAKPSNSQLVSGELAPEEWKIFNHQLA